MAPQSTDRVVQILGTIEHCLESVREILALVKPSPIRGPVHNYDPINYDEQFADDYGGFGMPGGRTASSAGSNGGFRNGGSNRGAGSRDQFNDRGSSGGDHRSNGRNVK